MSAPAKIVAARDALAPWLLNDAFPIWWRPGADLKAGGFHDTLDTAGRPIPGSQRVRVQARQVYAYRVAGELGWDGPWRQAMDHGLDALAKRFRRADGLYRSLPHDDTADLYDQAFVLLAFAQRPELEAAAVALLERLPRESAGGFAEFEGAALLANPNMHLFEAFMAWAEVSAAGPWRELAGGQARLAMTRLIDPETGAVSEIFGPAWTAPATRADRRVEPGHQFEWAWLLMQWSLATGERGALAAALRLIELGERCGVETDRNVAVNALDGDLQPTDLGTRLWPQTERLRTHLLAGAITGDAACWDLALKAADGLRRFLDVPTPGLWRDSLKAPEAPAPASSLYHLAGAISQLDQAVRE